MGLKEKLYLAGAARGVGRATENFRALREARAEKARNDERWKYEKQKMKAEVKLLEHETDPARFAMLNNKLSLGIGKMEKEGKLQDIDLAEKTYASRKRKETAEYNASHIAGMYQDNPDWLRDDYDMSLDKDGRASFEPKKRDTWQEKENYLSTDKLVSALNTIRKGKIYGDNTVTKEERDLQELFQQRMDMYKNIAGGRDGGSGESGGGNQPEKYKVGQIETVDGTKWKYKGDGQWEEVLGRADA